MNKKIAVIFLGLSGSGKGTQAKLLVEKLGLEYFGTGDLLRARKKNQDFTGKKIGEIIDAGKFVPSVIIAQLIIEGLGVLKEKSSFLGVVVDGATRILPEAKMLDEALEWYGWSDNTYVFLVDISKKEATLRLSKRRICKDCRKIIPYVGEFKDLEKCDACGGDLITRPDDSPQGIAERIEEYNKYSQPVIDYYEKQGRLIRINGEQSIEKVHEDIMVAIETK